GGAAGIGSWASRRGRTMRSGLASSIRRRRPWRGSRPICAGRLPSATPNRIGGSRRCSAPGSTRGPRERRPARAGPPHGGRRPRARGPGREAAGASAPVRHRRGGAGALAPRRRGLGANGGLAVPGTHARDVLADDAVRRLRERRAFTDRPPVSARLPISYHWLPGWARTAAAASIGRWNRRRVREWASFPGWPIDLSADALADLLDDGSPQRAGGPAPIVLTHDIDSAEGLANLVSKFVPLEEAVGARSTSYIVPCGWPVDHALVQAVVDRGHTVGVHGYDHSNRTPFANDAERARRLDAAKAFAQRYGAIGYRAPSLLRTRALLRDLGKRYRYDTSIPTSGGLFPVPNNGCATARPFAIEGVAELP